MKLRHILVTLPALLLMGCATAGYTPDRVPQMPAERQGLAPQYRFFYDALLDEGDWVLIEPFGYVFRPDVNFVAWRPYVEGFWAPTDIYGWVWVSSERFGWATYHYGQWMYDRFQGWVWLPGLEWGPAWVAWRESDDYVGWAPLMPSGIDYGAIPGGAFVFAPAMQLAATTVAAGILSLEQIGDAAGRIGPVQNFVERDGVMFNRGPSLDRIERLTGLLPRAAINDLIPAGQRMPGGALRERGAPANEDLVQLTRRAGADAARDAESAVEAEGMTPPRISVVRPVGRGVGAITEPPAPRTRKPAGKPSRKAAAPDSSR